MRSPEDVPAAPNTESAESARDRGSGQGADSGGRGRERTLLQPFDFVTLS